jgi:hypothetical protein
MPLDSIVEGFLGGFLRIVLWVAVEIVFEILIKGLGYIICRPFKKADIDDGFCAFVGIVTWIVLVLLLLWVLI